MIKAITTQLNDPKEVKSLFEKIVVNAGVGRASQQGNFENKILPQIERDLALVMGQKPHVRRAHTSIAGFKIREGQIVGLKATLRGKKMVDFFERLVRIVLPRVRDFAGIDRGGIDQRGSLHIGFKEQFVFPEINPEESPVVFSLGITIVPKRGMKSMGLKYESLGIPFKKEKKQRK